MRGTDLSSFLKNDLLFYQKKNGFRFGTDTFLLSSFVKLHHGERVIDLGTGCGIIPILLAKKYENAHFVGVDVVEESIQLSRENAKLNGVDDRFQAVLLNVKDVDKHFKPESFDVVITNPPFIEVERGKLNPKNEKAIAKHEILAKLKDFIRAANYLLKFRGRFYMICHTSRFTDTIHFCRNFNIEPKLLQFIHPRKGESASLFLLEARKGGGKGLEVLFPMVLFKNGNYSDELKERYENFFNDK